MLSYVELYVIKELNNNEDIIYLNILDRDFVFRAIGNSEYDNILRLVDNEKDLEDAICQSTILYPDSKDIAFGKYELAGVSGIASKEILKASGITDIERIKSRFKKRQEEMKNFYNQCVNLVKAAFPELAFEEIESFSWGKLVDYTVRAESIMAIRGSEYRIQFIEPEEGEEIVEEKEEIKIPSTYEYVSNGIDPMLYHAGELLNNLSKNILEKPFIGGLYWRSEGVIDGISKQL